MEHGALLNHCPFTSCQSHSGEQIYKLHLNAPFVLVSVRTDCHIWESGGGSAELSGPLGSHSLALKLRYRFGVRTINSLLLGANNF